MTYHYCYLVRLLLSHNMDSQSGYRKELDAYRGSYSDQVDIRMLVSDSREHT